jgi:hypothetical protein
MSFSAAPVELLNVATGGANTTGSSALAHS